MGLDATLEQAGVEKVAKIKRRPLNKPFLMVASSIEQLDDLVDVTKLTNQIQLSWPDTQLGS